MLKVIRFLIASNNSQIIIMKNLMMTAIWAAYQGGLEILEVYNADFEVFTKDDLSPLTLADISANTAIIRILSETLLPVLSEEGKAIAHNERKNWQTFWMVDPLDGTKEFVKKNGEFTVNIALISNCIAIGGVIYVPVTDKMYFGLQSEGAFVINGFSRENHTDLTFENLISVADTLPGITQSRPFTAVGSRSHMSPETESFFADLRQKHGEIDVVSMGSSLKICLVAEGVADVYPRFAPTMEWDTAAGHGIAKAAGKNIYDHTTGVEMVYNKENLLNNWFIVQ